MRVTMTILEAAKWIQDVGVYGILILIIYGGWKQWWVFGWQYTDKAKECESWKTIALKGLFVAERIVT
jgi:hypothetical protein